MKTELLATLATAQAAADALQSAVAYFATYINGIQDDPPATPPTPTVIKTYPVGGPLVFELAWDDVAPGVGLSIAVKGAPGNPAGPQEWTDFQINGIVGADGEKATYVLQNPTGQSILFRIAARIGTSDTVYGDPLTVNADDYPKG